MSVVINLIGGPGSGKSTTCSGLHYFLKHLGVNCEVAREFAKDAVWEGRTSLFDDIRHQQYIFAKQVKRLQDLDGKVDIILTDSPLLLSHVYAADAPQGFHDYIDYMWDMFENMTYFMVRNKPYNEMGRYQTQEEALTLDSGIRKLLMRRGVPYRSWNAATPDDVLKMALLLKETFSDGS